MNVLRLTTITLSLTLLVACGGGGGSSGATPTTNPTVNLERLPTPLIEASQVGRVRQLVGGMAPPQGAPTPSEIESKVVEIAGDSDALLFSEIATGGINASRMITCIPGMSMCTTMIDMGMGAGPEGGEEAPEDIDGPILFHGGGSLTGFNDEYSIVMTDGMIPLVQARAAGRRAGVGRIEYRSYGGWMDNSVFVIEYQNASGGGEMQSRSASYSFGDATESNPTANGTWRGVVIGIHRQNGYTIQGDASIVFDMTDSMVDITFDSIKNLDDGSDIDDMMWMDIMVNSGAFTSTDAVGMNGSISGNFYGDLRQEIGGIFDRGGIIGAFGAMNPPPPPEPLPAYAITNLAVARTLLSGTAPTSMTETQIVSEIQNRATAADTFEFSNFIGTPDVNITCSNTSESCSGSVPNVGSLTFSLADIGDLSLVDDMNLVGFNPDSRTVMTYKGATMIESRSAARQDDGTKLTFQTYGGWFDGSVFGVETLGITENGASTTRYASFSLGNKTGSNPTAEARWDGSMIGVEKADGDLIQGEAIIQWEPGSPNHVSGFFNNIRNITDNGNAATTLMTWESIPLTNGAFTSNDAFVVGTGSISGNFYGTDQAEVGGIFETTDLIGAFGGKKSN